MTPDWHQIMRTGDYPNHRHWGSGACANVGCFDTCTVVESFGPQHSADYGASLVCSRCAAITDGKICPMCQSVVQHEGNYVVRGGNRLCLDRQHPHLAHLWKDGNVEFKCGGIASDTHHLHSAGCPCPSWLKKMEAREQLERQSTRIEIWREDGGDPAAMLVDLMNAVDTFLEVTRDDAT